MATTMALSPYRNSLVISLRLLLVLEWVIFLSFHWSFGYAELQTFHHPLKPDGSISFLVIGDWGRKGYYNQSEVAQQMGRKGEEMNIDFVVSTGDNFYDNGLKDINDPNFQESFTNVYTAKSLQKPWFNVLGNHDYRGDVKAQLNPILRKTDSRWLCLRSFILNTEVADLFFVDTTPFVEEYFTSPDGQFYDWRDILPRQYYIANLLKDLELALARSTSTLKIVIGHHAIRSIAHHGDTIELIHMLLPMLQDNNVDFYINGHDHSLEQISCMGSPMQFFTSGGGSEAWRGDEKGLGDNKCAVNFFYDGQGFMSTQISSTNAKFVFYNVNGETLHSWNRSKLFHSSF
ncbi:purple acid phosphatase 4-like [Impatiens glandulifera]|uniref:purple acid phosphatase 4-like n=1 Tax=Impatiens glandulifera TaxID=253017 RepID=UPI001FB1317D|nr:purple acid phosphatase 4-like [Impatiens glandulifera]